MKSVFTILADYEKVHAMLDKGNSWEDATEELRKRGWRADFKSYDNWYAYTNQRLILGLKELSHAPPPAANTALIGELVEALGKVTKELTFVTEGESCDHSVGVCWCQTFRAIDDANAALAKASQYQSTAKGEK